MVPGSSKLIRCSRGSRATRGLGSRRRPAETSSPLADLEVPRRPPVQRHRQLAESRGLLELDEALLVKLEQTEEVHDDLHAGAGGRGQLAEGRRRTRQSGAQGLDDLGDGDLVDEDVVGLDVGHRRVRERTHGGVPDILGGLTGDEQVRLQLLEALVEPGEPWPGPRSGQLGAGRAVRPRRRTWCTRRGVPSR